jgi:hypothetical protein
VLLGALGLDRAAIDQVKTTLDGFAQQFNAVEQEHSTLTNRLPDGQSAGDFPALSIQRRTLRLGADFAYAICPQFVA